MPALFSLSVSRVMQFFGPSLVTAASSVLTPASNARLPSFDMIPLIKSPPEPYLTTFSTRNQNRGFTSWVMVCQGVLAPGWHHKI